MTGESMYKGAHPTDNADIWENKNGFFFVDEAEQLNGPYPTVADALVALHDYIATWLQPNPKAGNTTANLPQSEMKFYD